MAKPDLNPKIAEQPPQSDSLTDYDEQHLVTYLRLLDAEQEGASRVEMARVILGIEPNEEPERALKAVETHLERAQWVAEKGFLNLLK